MQRSLVGRERWLGVGWETSRVACQVGPWFLLASWCDVVRTLGFSVVLHSQRIISDPRRAADYAGHLNNGASQEKPHTRNPEGTRANPGMLSAWLSWPCINTSVDVVSADVFGHRGLQTVPAKWCNIKSRC